jgi:hypothetical protein
MGKFRNCLCTEYVCWGWNPATFANGYSENAIFNFIAANIDGDSALLHYDSLGVIHFIDNNPGLERVSGLRITELIDEIGTSALSESSVISWVQDDSPAIWGNIVGASDINYDSWHRLKETSAFYVNPTFVILTPRQYNFWDDRVDMTLVDL